MKTKAKTRYLKAIDYINSLVQIVDIKKFYKDLHNQQHNNSALNTSMNSQTGDSNGKEKRSVANRSVEFDRMEPVRNSNLLDLNEKNVSKKSSVNRRRLDNLSPVKNHKIGGGGTNTTRFASKK